MKRVRRRFRQVTSGWGRGAREELCLILAEFEIQLYSGGINCPINLSASGRKKCAAVTPELGNR